MRERVRGTGRGSGCDGRRGCEGDVHVCRVCVCVCVCVCGVCVCACVGACNYVRANMWVDVEHNAWYLSWLRNCLASSSRLTCMKHAAPISSFLSSGDNT